MGQCFSWSYGGANRAPQNRRFEYTPKKSWKYKDAHMMTQFQALSMDSEEEDGGLRRNTAPTNQFSVGGLTSGSEDELYEVDLTNSRNTSKLMFTQTTPTSGQNPDDSEDEEELDRDAIINQPKHKNTLVNKGFQPLEDQSYDSPRMARLDNENEDRELLLTNDSLLSSSAANEVT